MLAKEAYVGFRAQDNATARVEFFPLVQAYVGSPIRAFWLFHTTRIPEIALVGFFKLFDSLQGVVAPVLLVAIVSIVLAVHCFFFFGSCTHLQRAVFS